MERTLFNLHSGHFENLLKNKLSLDAIFVLENIINGTELAYENPKTLGIIQSLQRKGYLDNKAEITAAGKELHESLFQEVEQIKTKKPAITTGKFDEWWDIYPATDMFTMNGKEFPGTQKKNIRKDDCRRLFAAITQGNEFTADDIIRATRYHINVAKSMSWRTKDNKLTYIPNSERYLREKYFAPYVEPSKSVSVTNSQQSNAVDI